MSAATRQRILRAARALSYVPSETGRSLSTRATRRIGIVSAELTNPFYPELVEPLRAELERVDYRALLVPDNPNSPVGVERLADGSLDGVVLTTATIGSAVPYHLIERGIPFVMVNRVVDDVEADACVMDNNQGGAQVASMIVELGHNRVGAVFGPANTSTSRDREAGFRQGLSEHGLALPQSAVRRGPFSYETGRTATLELLDLPDRPTALFCSNDVLALGALNAAAARGIVPGKDLTVIGFDDIAAASWDVFNLTTVRCDLHAMATDAIGLLMQRLKDPRWPPRQIVLAGELIARATHAQPPRASTSVVSSI